MKLDDFEKLSPDVQMDVIHKEGTYIGKRKAGAFTIMLFQLESFYIEVHYESYRSKVDHLVTSRDTEILKPYLDQIKLKDFLDPEKKNE